MNFLAVPTTQEAWRALRCLLGISRRPREAGLLPSALLVSQQGGLSPARMQPALRWPQTPLMVPKQALRPGNPDPNHSPPPATQPQVPSLLRPSAPAPFLTDVRPPQEEQADVSSSQSHQHAQ